MIGRRLRSAAAAAAFAVAVLIGSGGCSDDGGSEAVAPPTTTTPRSPTPTTAVRGAVTVRGTVLTVFSSAQVLQLDPPVDGYSRVALTPATEYRGADGSPASLADIDEGSTVEVTGVSGESGTVIARRVALLG